MIFHARVDIAHVFRSFHKNKKKLQEIVQRDIFDNLYTVAPIINMVIFLTVLGAYYHDVA